MNSKEAKAKKFKELNAIKTKFYTNITHEFRTPLTIISGMADRVIDQPDIWMERGMNMIKRNTAVVLNLVNQLLDLRKLESGKLQVKMKQDDIVQYLHYITQSFQSYAESKNIHLHFLSDLDTFKMDYDEDKMLIIFSKSFIQCHKVYPH